MAIISKSIIGSALVVSVVSGKGTGTAGTGFLMMDLEEKKGRVVSGTGWVVTCAHVVEKAVAEGEEGERIILVMNDGENKEKVVQHHGGFWETHPRWKEERESEYDVAVAPIKEEMVGTAKKDMWFGERIWGRKEMKENEIWEGTRILTLGFPAGINTGIGKGVSARVWPLLGQGVIARIGPWLEGEAETYMIEANVYPGQSGSPVITYPEVMGMTGGAKGVQTSKLIGVMCERTFAHGMEKGEMETGAYGRVVGMDKVWETIRFWREKHPGLHAE